MVAGDDGLEYQAAACAAGGIKREADALHDPDNLALQRVLGDSQRSQPSRKGRLRLAPPRTALRGRRNRPARLKSDGLLVGHLSRQAALGLSALDSLPQGMLVVDAHCRIEYANTAVQRFLGPSSPLRSANGRLQCARSEHQARLQLLVRTACASPCRAGALECQSSHPQMDRLIASVLPLKSSHTLASAWQIPMAVVILVVPGAIGGLDHRVVGEMLGLSPAEARLALLLTAGKSIKDFAVAEGCSWHTARTHARNLMAKTGCHRQVELVQLVQALQME